MTSLIELYLQLRLLLGNREYAGSAPVAFCKSGFFQFCREQQAKQQQKKSVSEWAEGAAMSAKGGALGASSATRAWPLCYWSTPWPTVYGLATAPRQIL